MPTRYTVDIAGTQFDVRYIKIIENIRRPTTFVVDLGRDLIATKGTKFLVYRDGVFFKKGYIITPKDKKRFGAWWSSFEGVDGMALFYHEILNPVTYSAVTINTIITNSLGADGEPNPSTITKGTVDAFAFLPQQKKWDTDTDFNAWVHTNTRVKGTGAGADIRYGTAVGITSGNAKSDLVSPANLGGWKNLDAARTTPAGASLTWDVLDSLDMIIPGFSAIPDSQLPKDISSIIQNSIKVRANLSGVIFTLEEQQATDSGSVLNMTDTVWIAQTFQTPASGFVTVNRVEVKISNNNAAAKTVRLSIRNVDGAGKPTGADLASADVSVAASTTAILTFDITGVDLSSNTKYAIVCRNITDTLTLGWNHDGSVNAYANGQAWRSNDSGATWPDSFATTDCFFKTYQRDGPIVDTVLVDYTADSITLTRDRMTRAQHLLDLAERVSAEVQMRSTGPTYTDDIIDFKKQLGTDRSATVTLDDTNLEEPFEFDAGDWLQETDKIFGIGGGSPRAEATVGTGTKRSVLTLKFLSDVSTLKGVLQKQIDLRGSANGLRVLIAQLRGADIFSPILSLGDKVNVNISGRTALTNVAYRIVQIEREGFHDQDERVRLWLANQYLFEAERDSALKLRMLEEAVK